MLSNTPGKKLPEYVKDYVIFDLETTGFSAEKDAIIEISAIKVMDKKVVDEFSTLVNPKRMISSHIISLTGIDNKMVTDAPYIEAALESFIEFIGDSILVGHNIHSFDMKFIYHNVQSIFGKTLDNDYIDTLELAKVYLPRLSHRRLVDLAEYYGISPEGAHRALNDCRMNQQIFERLASEMANPSEDVKNVKKCPKCGSFLKLRNGRFGEFWGCSGYPVCRFTENA